MRTAAFLLFAVAGCGPSGPDLVPVSGTVAFANGKPVSGGVIEFAPETGPAARGAIGPDGRFTLTTGDRPGAVAGKHRVTVVQGVLADAAPVAHARGKHAAFAVPPKYARSETSGLEFTVAGPDDAVKIVVQSAK